MVNQVLGYRNPVQKKKVIAFIYKILLLLVVSFCILSCYRLDFRLVCTCSAVASMSTWRVCNFLSPFGVTPLHVLPLSHLHLQATPPSQSKPLVSPILYPLGEPNIKFSKADHCRDSQTFCLFGGTHLISGRT